MAKQNVTLAECNFLIDGKCYHKDAPKPCISKCLGKEHCGAWEDSIKDNLILPDNTPHVSPDIQYKTVANKAWYECSVVNPSNPQAVAEQIEAMYKNLKELHTWLDTAGFDMVKQMGLLHVFGEVNAVINAIEKGE